MKYGLDNIQNLIAACTIGDAAAAERFLDEGASPNGVRLVDGASAVYIASWHGHAEIIRLLADRGAELDRSCNNKSPLYMACVLGHLEAARELLRAGANPHYAALCYREPRQMFSGRWNATFEVTPVWGACLAADQYKNATFGALLKNAALPRLFLSHGVDLDVKSEPRGRTQLHSACVVNDVRVARVLLRYGADALRADNDGMTPLDAARRGSLDTAVKTPLDAIYYDTAPHEHCNPNNSNLNRLLDSYLPSHWKLRVALTFGRLTGRDAELAGHRIAPLIGSFVVGDVLLRKKKR